MEESKLAHQPTPFGIADILSGRNEQQRKRIVLDGYHHHHHHHQMIRSLLPEPPVNLADLVLRQRSLVHHRHGMIKAAGGGQDEAPLDMSKSKYLGEHLFDALECGNLGWVIFGTPKWTRERSSVLSARDVLLRDD